MAASLVPADYAKLQIAVQETVAKERNTRRQWRYEWKELADIYKDYANKVDNIYEKHLNELLPRCDYLYNSKLNDKITRILKKQETAQLIDWPPYSKTTNGEYGRLVHLTVDKYERYRFH